MSYVTAIVVAAGKGLRLKSRITKPLIKIGSRPIIFYCLYNLSRHPQIKDIIVVVSPAGKKGILRAIRQYRIGKIRKVVLGGVSRKDSVFCGLQAVPARTDLALIHDAARPFIGRSIISRVIRQAAGCGAAIAGIPVKDTIKSSSVDKLRYDCRTRVEKTLKREHLWEIQTPQAFKKELILRAYEKHGHAPVTDDSGLVERLGYPVSIVKGSSLNIKITTPEDLLIAEAMVGDPRCHIA